MSTLILYLPTLATGNAPEYDYVVLRDDQQIASHGRAIAALLPAAAQRGEEVVAVVPARALSWHQLALPGRVAASVLSGRAEPMRARAVIGGALEEHLLDDVERLHFAAFAGAGDAPLWVAVCDRSWLKSALQALDAAGLRAVRVVAECEPVRDIPGALAVVTDAMEPAQVALCTPQGVTLLPLGEAAQALAATHSPLAVVAEPAVMGLAEQAFGVPALAQTLAQRLAKAAQSPWNLAQLDLNHSKGGRAMRQMGGAWKTFASARQWRPVRWALVALLLTQVFALNAVAYKEKALLEQKRQAIESVLMQTFPNVQVIVDAPVQMQREVGALAQSRGASDLDLARLLTAVSTVATDAKALSAIDLAAGQLRLRGEGLSDADAASLSSALQPQGLVARLEGDQLTIQTQGGR